MDRLIPLIVFSFLWAGPQDSVLSAIKSDALKKGIPESFLNETFSHSGIEIHNKILDRFAKPYEKKSWTDYRKLFVTDSRIQKGSDFYAQHKNNLNAVAIQISMDPFLILSIVGVESNYGRHRGQFTVFNALYTQIAKMPHPFVKVTKIAYFYPYFLHKPANPHFGQHLVAKIFMKKENPEPALNNLNFEIFISQIPLKIFYFEFYFREDRIFK